MSKNSGEWQAQGDDIPGRGHRVDWGQDEVPTKTQGLRWLHEVGEECTGSQRSRRETTACRDARRFVARVPPEGYPTTSRQFYARDGHYKNARIDLEIRGMAFKDDKGGGHP